MMLSRKHLSMFSFHRSRCMVGVVSLRDNCSRNCSEIQQQRQEQHHNNNVHMWTNASDHRSGRYGFQPQFDLSTIFNASSIVIPQGRSGIVQCNFNPYHTSDGYTILGANSKTPKLLRCLSAVHGVAFSTPIRFVHSLNSSLFQKKSGTMSDEQAKAQTAKPAADPEDTIFGKILKGQIPTKFIYEDDLVVAFDDINPVAPVHFLVIPRKAIPQLSKSSDEDEQILGRMMCVARKLAEQKGIAKDGYRLVMNNGCHGCQSVYHIHLHVIGGRQLGWPPCEN